MSGNSILCWAWAARSTIHNTIWQLAFNAEAAFPLHALNCVNQTKRHVNSLMHVASWSYPHWFSQSNDFLKLYNGQAPAAHQLIDLFLLILCLPACHSMLMSDWSYWLQLASATTIPYVTCKSKSKHTKPDAWNHSTQLRQAIQVMITMRRAYV